MKKEIYDKIGNFVFIAIAIFALFVNKFPQYNLWFTVLAFLVISIAAFSYFKNQWNDIDAQLAKEQMQKESEMALVYTSHNFLASSVIFESISPFFEEDSTDFDSCAYLLEHHKISHEFIGVRDFFIGKTNKDEFQSHIVRYAKGESKTKNIMIANSIFPSTKTYPKLKHKLNSLECLDTSYYIASAA